MSRESQLILIASRISLGPEAVTELRELLKGPMDWAAVLALAIPHGVLPLISHNLTTTANDLVPGDLLSQLQSYAQRIRARNEKALAELARLLQTLGNQGIEAIPFKGPTLQQTLYRGLPLREFADLDLMVRREDAPAAAMVMESEGYRLADRQQTKGLQALLRNGDAAEFVHPRKMTVDLHWRFSNVGFDFPLDACAITSELEVLDIAGRPARTYAAETNLLILSAHQAKHRWRRLNWLCDVAALLENRSGAVPWPATLERARDLRCERILLTTLRLAELLLGATLPRPAHDRLGEDTKTDVLARSLGSAFLETPVRNRWLYLQMREGGRLSVYRRYVTSKLRWHLA